VIAWDRRGPLPDDEPVELDEIREITRLALGTDYGIHDPRWMSRFHSDERQAPATASATCFWRETPRMSPHQRAGWG
jgi:hypothetical protein